MKSLVKAFNALVALLMQGVAIWTRGGQVAAEWFLRNFTRAVASTSIELSTQLAPELRTLLQTMITLVEQNGPILLKEIEPVFGALAAHNFNQLDDLLKGEGTSEPDRAVNAAAVAIAKAFGFGASSAGITALFESIFPEKLNALNAAGPIFAGMAGFEEIAGAVRKPLYDAAFGQSLKYYYRAQFKPELPDEANAVLWNARGLLKDGQLDRIFQYSGLKSEFEEAFKLSAYRAVSPFVVARATSTGDMKEDDLIDILKFNGYRDKDIHRLIAAFEAVAVEPYRKAALAQFVAAAERGLYTDTALDSELASFKLPKGADNWVKREIAYRRLLQLTNLYEKSVSEGYKYQQVTDSEYIPDMETIGLNPADAAARYAIDSIVSRGRAAIAAQRDAARLARERETAELRRLSYQYIEGLIDEPIYVAGIASLGLDPVIAAARIELDTARREAAQVDVFGKIVNRHDAPLLREKVAATEEQVLKKLLTPGEGLAALASYGIPDANARALVAKWEAEALKTAITP